MEEAPINKLICLQATTRQLELEKGKHGPCCRPRQHPLQLFTVTTDSLI